MRLVQILVYGAVLRDVVGGRTTLAIAHRQGALAHADRVVVLEAGRVAP